MANGEGCAPKSGEARYEPSYIPALMPAIAKLLQRRRRAKTLLLPPYIVFFASQHGAQRASVPSPT